MNVPVALPSLPVGQYRILFRGEPRAAAGYAGSAWRGAFGHALKRAVCVTRLPRCSACLLYRSCVFPYLFDTPPPEQAKKMRRYEAAPHPFVFQVPLATTSAGPDTHYEIGINLFGRANQHLPYVIHALTGAGADGVGRGKPRWELVAVEQRGDDNGWSRIYEPGQALAALPSTVVVTPPLPSTVRIRLLTPLRVRRAEQLVSSGAFTFADLFNVLLRRVSMLTYFHTDTPLETDFRALVDQSRQVGIHAASLRWYDWTRYSSRQQTTMQMGGLLGEIELNAEGIEPFWPYLWLGQWTHAGKGASMGLGCYVIEEAGSPGTDGVNAASLPLHSDGNA